MTRTVEHIQAEPLRDLMEQLVRDQPRGRVDVLFPEVLALTAQRLCDALEFHDFSPTLRLAPEAVFRERSAKEAAEYCDDCALEQHHSGHLA